MRKLLTGLLLAGTFMFTGGCDEEGPANGTAKIYVYNQEGEPIQNALVQFKSPVDVPNGLEVYKYTEIDGSAFVRWDYDLFVDVRVVKGGYSGCNAVRIIPGKTTEKDLILFPFNTPGNGCP